MLKELQATIFYKHTCLSLQVMRNRFLIQVFLFYYIQAQSEAKTLKKKQNKKSPQTSSTYGERMQEASIPLTVCTLACHMETDLS